MSDSKISITKVLICLPKPLYAPAGVIWQISGDLLRAGYHVDEFQFFHILVPQLLTNEPYLVLVSSDLLDLSDYTNTDRAAMIRTAMLLPQSSFIIWDKTRLWKPTDTPDPSNLQIWKDQETNSVTQKILKLLKQDETSE